MLHPAVQRIVDTKDVVPGMRAALVEAEREHHNAILAAAELGIGVAQIAEAAGVSRSRIYKRIHRPVYGDRAGGIAPPRRRRPTYELLPRWSAYGHTMTPFAPLGGSMTADEGAAYLADLRTPHGGEHGPVPGKLGIGWYPHSMAGMLRQVALHGYSVKCVGGVWTLHDSADEEEVVARAECYRLAAVDVAERGPMESVRL